MERLEQYKAEHLSKFSQLILLDDHAKIVSSCDSIFPTTQYQEQAVTEWFPFMESIFPSLLDLKPNFPEIRFSRVETPLESLSGNYDFTFTRVILEGKQLILWSIFDYTDLYEYFKEFQQRRNELEIHRQMLEQRYKQLKHQTDILTQQNLALEKLNKKHSSYYTKVRKAIQSPVNALDGLTFLLSNLSQQQDKDYISTLKNAVKHLTDIITEFQDSAIANGQTKEITSFNINELLIDVSQQFTSAINYKNKLNLNIVNELPQSVTGNVVYTRQIIYSLLLNSFKNDPSATISLDVSTLVSDQQSTTIQFRLFEKASSAINNDIIQNSTDLFLRLSVVKKMVELLGGIIKLDNQNDDNDVCILLELPFEMSENG